MRQYELEELAKIYEERGLPKELAHDVAVHLTKNDGAHTLSPSAELHQGRQQISGVMIPVKAAAERGLQRCPGVLQ